MGPILVVAQPEEQTGPHYNPTFFTFSGNSPLKIIKANAVTGTLVLLPGFQKGRDIKAS
jgi:hypothetical protein